MKSGRKPPRPKTINCSKGFAYCNCEMTCILGESTSLDFHPKIDCVLHELSVQKLGILLNGHPSSRSVALVLQALRQQLSIPISDEYVQASLLWIVTNDVLTLKQKKNSVVCRILQADGVDSREQMARLVNTIASYPKGRQYFTVHLKTFLPCVIALVRGKRLPTTTHDQLIVCLEKMSLRNSSQKELLNSGMLEWSVTHLDQKLTSYAFEYISAFLVNLSTNYHCSSIMTRFADNYASSVVKLLSKSPHGACCSIYNNLVLASLGCSRIRLRAKETKLFDTILSRLENRRNCPLCSLHVPFLIAIINNEVESAKTPTTPTEPVLDDDPGTSSCEREVNASDPLRPSTNELSGARLLLRKAFKEHHDEPVSRNGSLISQEIGPVNKNRNEARVGTATSQHTFIIETESRKPIMINLGLTEGALSYKSTIDAKTEAERLAKEKIDAEREAKEREFQKNLRHLQLTTRKAPSLLRKELEAATTPSEEKRVFSKVGIRKTLLKRNPMSNIQQNEAPKTSPKEEEKKSESTSSESLEDYATVFGARPKLARTPDTQSKSKSFF